MGTAACTSREFWVTFLSKGSLEEVLNDTGWQTSDSGILYLIEGWANSFYWKKAWRKNLGGEEGFLKCLCFVIYTCHIFLCIYQVLHNKIKRLKIKRKRRHNRKPKSFSTGHSQMVFWSALPGLLSGAASEGWGSTAQSCFFDPTQQGTWASSQSFNQERDLQHHLQLHFLLPSARISAWFQPQPPTQLAIIVLEYTVGPTIFQTQWNVLNKASYQLLPPTPRDFTSHYLIPSSTQEKHPLPFPHRPLGGGEGIFLWMWLPSLTFSASYHLLPFWTLQFHFRMTCNYFHQGLAST